MLTIENSNHTLKTERL